MAHFETRPEVAGVFSGMLARCQGQCAKRVKAAGLPP